jgi:hypothetical protein
MDTWGRCREGKRLDKRTAIIELKLLVWKLLKINKFWQKKSKFSSLLANICVKLDSISAC